MYYYQQVMAPIQVSAVVSSELMPERSPRNYDSQCQLIQVHGQVTTRVLRTTDKAPLWQARSPEE